jgi:hypothetical protein
VARIALLVGDQDEDVREVGDRTILRRHARSVTLPPRTRNLRVLFRQSLASTIAGIDVRARKESDLNALAAYLTVRAAAILALLEGPTRRQPARRLASERGQGTVEYVGLILLVSLLMVGMVAAMKGFNGQQGTELAELIVTKIKSAVNAISFR